MQNKLDPKYQARLATFEHIHPSAYKFVMRLQQEGSEHGLWLSTATNAHLYKGDAFLAYLKFNSTERKPASLLLSPRFNLLIHNHASDESALLFPKLINKLIMASRGFSARWALPRNGNAIELMTNAPDSFFDTLFTTLTKLELPGEQEAQRLAQQAFVSEGGSPEAALAEDAESGEVDDEESTEPDDAGDEPERTPSAQL